MKFRSLILIPLSMCFMLSGCSSETTSTTPTSTTTDYNETDYPSIDFKEEDYICSNGSYGGMFLDVNVGRNLCDNSTYEFVYTSSYTVDTSFTVKCTPAALANVEITSENRFNLKTNEHTGDFIMKIENAQGLLVYRNVVHVRKAVPVEEVGNELFNKDVYKSDPTLVEYIGSWRLSFTSASPLVGAITGGDDLEQGVTISFELTYEDYQKNFDCYHYKAKTISTTASQTDITMLMIARCLDYIYVYEDSGLLTMLRP